MGQSWGVLCRVKGKVGWRGRISETVGRAGVGLTRLKPKSFIVMILIDFKISFLKRIIRVSNSCTYDLYII